MTHHPTRPLLLVLLTLCTLNPSLQAAMEIRFVGLQSIHVEAWHTPATNEVAYSLTVLDPSGGETTVLDGPSNGRKIRIGADPAEGTYTARTTVETVDEKGTHFVDESESDFDVASGVRGIMLFDEALDSPESSTMAGSVQVPSGITLTLSGRWSAGSFGANGGEIQILEGYFDGNFFSASQGGTVLVEAGAMISTGGLAASEQGSIELSDGAPVGGVSFHVYPGGVLNPGDATGFSGNRYHYYDAGLSGYAPLQNQTGTIILEAGSEGARLRGEGYSTIVRTSPIQFDLANSTVQIETPIQIFGGITESRLVIGQPVIPSTFTAKVELSNLTLSALELWGTVDCKVSGCEVGGSTVICMGKPVLSDNLFAGNVIVSGGSGAQITGNALHGTLVYSGWDPAMERPVVENNDLLHPQAVIYRSNILFSGEPDPGAIQIGSCYYGSSVGPNLTYGGGFLGQGSGHQGGWVTVEDYTSPVNRTDLFTLAPPRKTRSTALSPSRYPPRYWVSGWASGQGVLRWTGNAGLQTLYKKIPTLLSFDVKTTDRMTSTPPLYLKLQDSTIIQPTFLPPALSRDLADFSKTRIRIGGTTANFTLPETTASTVHFSLCMQNSQGQEETLTEGQLEFIDHPWKRPLKIAVIPIGVEYNFSSTAPPASAPTSRFLKYAIPSMLPIPHGLLQVDIKSPEWMETHVGLFSNLPGIASLAAKLSLWYVDYLAKPRYDLVVAVMPENSIRLLSAEIGYFLDSAKPASGANFGYGENFWLSTPRICFVDASKPMASLHEIGHAAGLYRDVEQYDMAEYKPTEGMVLRGFSSAALDPGIGNVINGFPPSGILHFAESNMTWYTKDYVWIDVMGLPETEVWTSPSTHGAMMSFFTSLLNSTNTTSSTASNPHPPTSLSPMDLSSPAITLSGTIISPTGQNPQFLPVGNTAMETSYLPTPAPELDPASNWWQYGIVRFYDATGTLLAENDFDFPIVASESTWWTGSLSLPPSCTRFSLFGHAGGTDTLKTSWSHAGTLSVQINRATLSNSPANALSLAWDINASNPQPDTHFTSQLFCSLDNGSSWQYLGRTTDQTHLAIPTEFLPKTTQLSLRVVTSDGFTSTHDTVSNITLTDRPPTLAILQPRHGDTSRANTEWPLQAHATDPEDGDLPVTWTSSLNGNLTSPASLSTGTHQLTCSTTDSAGHPVSQTITVSVSPTTTSSDLTIDSLTLLGLHQELRQNWNMTPDALVAHQTNVLDCIIHNSGIPTEGLVTLQITLPNGTTTALPSVLAEFTAFDLHRISFPFVPTTYGPYQLTVSVEPLDWTDHTPLNNTASISTYTHAPTLLVRSSSQRQEFVLLESRYDYPPPTPPDPVIPITTSDYTELYNGSQVPLTIHLVALTCGPDFYGTDHFRLYPPPAQTPLTLAPGEALPIHLEFYGKTLNPESTTLRVLSDDPSRPDFEIPVHGWIYHPDEDTWRDPDSDGIPSFLETAIGLNPDNPDSDNDGIPDGMEDRNANGLRETYETGALDPDTDDDGLLDGQEDLNANGGHDGQETSALLADSDGDGFSDLEEAHARTNGLHAQDHLQLTHPTLHPDGISLQWEGRAGVPYRVEFSPDFVQWQLAPTGPNPDQQPLTTPPVNAPTLYRSPIQPGPGFYRLSLQNP